MKEYKFDQINMTDVCLLLGISPGEVRKLCREGKIKATKRDRSIQWDIPTDQFRDHPNWDKFLLDVEERRQRNIKFCEIMLKILDSDDEE